MERPCRNPACPNTLSQLVPVAIEYCGECQYILKNEIPGLVKSWLGGRTLPAKCIFFLFEHQKGCAEFDLLEFLPYKPRTIRKYLQRGKIRGRRVEGQNNQHKPQWRIELTEIVRLMDISFNWIKFTQVVRELNREFDVDYCTLLLYANLQLCGPIGRDLEGHRALLKSEITDLPETYQETKRQRLAHPQRDRIYEGMAVNSLKRVGKIIDAPRCIVLRLTEVGVLTYILKGERRLVKDPDVIDLIQKIAAGLEVSCRFKEVNARSQKRCRDIISRQIDISTV